MEYIHTVNLILQHGGTLDNGYPRHLSFGFCSVDILDLFTLDQKILMGNIAESHAKICEHVIPLPTML